MLPPAAKSFKSISDESYLKSIFLHFIVKIKDNNLHGLHKVFILYYPTLSVIFTL